MIVITHEVPAQNESCEAASATPPALTTPKFFVVLSEERRTWYSEPLYAEYSARVVECAATHGVPPAAKMSQTPWPGGGGVGDEDGDDDGEADGDELGVLDGDGVGEPVPTTPVHATPFRLNEAGIGLELLFQEPLNPKLVLAPVPRDPLYDTFVTVTFAPDWV